ncbi:MAG: endonuclease/exonuclease/phosphatase family protein [Candidatus Sumerlaeia bacterium]|nr:endonuclease/exonuclease/phosphatase family protein [Candidatus Sumerlaeia bacterium]
MATFMGMATADPDKSTLRAISIDGDFSDWDGISPLVTSGTGTAGGINFGRVWAANDQEYLYLKVEVGRETIWQEPTSLSIGNDIRILIDGNANSNSGSFMEGIDVNFEIGLGNRYTEVHWSGSNSSTYNFSRAGILGLPTYSSDTFEFRIPRTIRPFSTNIDIITGNTIRFVLVDGSGARVPASGSMQYTMAGGNVAPPPPISFERMDAGDVRVLVHNAEDTAPADPDIRPHYERYLLAMQPDIICFQEIYSPHSSQRPDVTLRWTPEQARNWIASFLDPAPGEQWHVAGSGDNVTISKWPIIGTAGTSRYLAAHIDMPEEISLHNLVIFNAHTPCCQNNSGRDAVHDEISSMWRNLLNGTGPFVIDPNAAVIMAGDFNMVGFVRQLETLRDGRIINNSNWGPSFSPARADGSLTSAPLRHSHARDIYTWRRLGPTYSPFAPGKLDYIFFSGDVMELRRNFVLDTSTTPQAVLNQYNMTANLSESASDHLVMVADFEFPRLELVEHGNQWLVH